jgi:hypothetical protein
MVGQPNFNSIFGGRATSSGTEWLFPFNDLASPVRVLTPKVRLFNQFMRRRTGLYEDMRMWHYKAGERSTNYTPAPIPDHLVTEGAFVFLGKRQRSDRIDYEVILNDFDRLLELYKYTEGGRESQTASVQVQFEFRQGFKSKALSAIATQLRKRWRVILRHNKLQEALWRQLQSQFGAENVIPEFSNLGSTRADIVVLRSKGDWFYEIKTGDPARKCLREALGQVLEYAFWPPGARMVSRLIVVGEAAMDKDCEKYLQLLKKRFLLPIEYQQIIVE